MDIQISILRTTVLNIRLVKQYPTVYFKGKLKKFIPFRFVFIYFPYETHILSDFGKECYLIDGQENSEIYDFLLIFLFPFSYDSIVCFERKSIEND